MRMLIKFGRLFSAMPMAVSADDVGDWTTAEESGEEEVIMESLDVWPYFRHMNEWGRERYSDEAVSDLVFNSFGQQRIERVKMSDAAAPPGATYAVYLNFLVGLETRPGFAKLGADAYFAADQRLLAIAVGPSLYVPAGPAGTSRRCREVWDDDTLSHDTQCGSYELGWSHAKSAFRGSLLCAVTLIEHLTFLHLGMGNALVTATVESLPPDHPIRRLVTPFGYRTVSVNTAAAGFLTAEFGALHRATPLTAAGIMAGFEYAKTDRTGFSSASPLLQYASKDIDELELPLHRDGTDYFNILSNFSREYIDLYYPTGTCADDEDLVRWYTQIESLFGGRYGSLPAPLDCKRLIDLLATAMFYVTAMHRFVGNLPSEASDPCFAPMARREGQVCGPPRTMLDQAALFQGTGSPQPLITEDYSHVLLDDDGRRVWQQMTSRMVEFGVEVNARNLYRKRPFTVFDPARIEVSIAI